MVTRWWRIGKFGRARDGAVILLFALCLPLVLGFAGLGFDYVRAALVQQRLQQASDAAALAGAASRGDEAQRRAIAANVFAANYGRGWLAPDAVPEVTFGEEGRVTVTARAGFVPTFLTGIGQGRVEMAAAGAAKHKGLDLEIALVVDLTGSMRNSAGSGRTRIEALKVSAHRLIDTILASKSSAASFKLAIVPFTTNVNVGTNNSGFVDQSVHSLFHLPWRGCVLERRGADAFSDAYSPVAAGTDGKWHAYVAPPEPDLPPAGQAKSCRNPSNGTMFGYANAVESGPGDRKITYNGPNYNCTKHPIMALTDDEAAIRAKIDALNWEDNAGTNAGPGISWAMRALSPTAPFSEGTFYSPQTRKVIILMTDGEQKPGSQESNCKLSQNSNEAYHFPPSYLRLDGTTLNTYGPGESFSAYGYVMASNPFNSTASSGEARYNEIARRACAAAKEQGAAQRAPIEIYSVAFSDGIAVGGATEATLKACASNPNTHYFHAITGGELDDTFQEIARNLFKIRLAN